MTPPDPSCAVDMPDGDVGRGFENAPVLRVKSASALSPQAAVQQAIDAPGGPDGARRIVDLDEGLVPCSDLTVGSGTWLRGKGMDRTILKRRGPFTDGLVRLAPGAGDIVFSDMTFDGDSGTDARSLVALGAHGSNIVFLRCRFRNGCDRWALRSSVMKRFDRLHIIGCEFENLPAGGIIILPGSADVRGSTDLRVIGCRFERVGANLCQFADYMHGIHSFDRSGFWRQVMFNGNTITNCLDTGAAGAIPCEIWAASQFQQIANVIDSGTRGLTAGGGTEDAVIACNVISNQTTYAMEGGQSRRVRIFGNRIIDCASFYKDTGIISWDGTRNYSPAMCRLENVEIHDNTITGTGLKQMAGSVNTISFGCDGTTVPTGVKIYNNTFTDIENIRSVVRFQAQDTHPQIALPKEGTGARVDYLYKAVGGRVLDRGTGYSRPPQIRLRSRDGNGSGAAATCSVRADGSLDQVTVTAAGSGYTQPPEAALSGGGGSGGRLEIYLGIERISVVEGGHGYRDGPFTVTGNGGTQAAGTCRTAGGAITECSVEQPGWGYGRPSDLECHDNSYVARTYPSCVSFMTYGQGRIDSRNNRWERHAPFDKAHPGAGAPVVYLLSGSLHPQGQPHCRSQGDSAEMHGAVTGVGLAAFGRAEAPVPRYGCSVEEMRVAGTFPANPFWISDTSGSTRLERIDVSGLTLDLEQLRGHIDPSCLLGLASGDFLFAASTYVDLSALSGQSKARLICVGPAAGRRRVRLRHNDGPALPAPFSMALQWAEHVGRPSTGAMTVPLDRAPPPSLAQSGDRRLTMARDDHGRGEASLELALPPATRFVAITLEAHGKRKVDWSRYAIEVS